MSDCIFCRIASGEIPSRKIFEDDLVFAFHDINPVAPLHFLVVPKVHIPSMAELDATHEALVGRIMAVGARLARELGAEGGWRTIVNTGRVGRQEVFHLHIHFIGGPDVLPAMLKY